MNDKFDQKPYDAYSFFSNNSERNVLLNEEN